MSRPGRPQGEDRSAQHEGTPVSRRVLTLCADDFGLSAPISRGIAMLARAQRLSAVSCITNAAHWREAARALRGLPLSVTVGLHFNLTEGRPLSRELARVWPELPSLPRLLLLSHLHQLPRCASNGRRSSTPSCRPPAARRRWSTATSTCTTCRCCAR